jgi:hypothetical protein
MGYSELKFSNFLSPLHPPLVCLCTVLLSTYRLKTLFLANTYNIFSFNDWLIRKLVFFLSSLLYLAQLRFITLYNTFQTFILFCQLSAHFHILNILSPTQISYAILQTNPVIMKPNKSQSSFRLIFYNRFIGAF